MILRIPQVILVAQVLVLLVLINLPVQVSSSKGKSKATKRSSSPPPSHHHTSGHQFGDEGVNDKFKTMKPSKPDPHFDILDEQRAFYLQGRHRDGRDGSYEQKPTKPKKQATSNPNIKKGKKGKGKQPYISIPGSITTFGKKIYTDRTQPRFSGSHLISGSAGIMPHAPSPTTQKLERDGWKILMGPSVSPNDAPPAPYSSTVYTSLTDGKHERTVSKARKLTNGSSKYSSKSTHSESSYSTSKGGSNHKIASTRRSMQVVPKQKQYKYAKITRRTPSKSSVQSGSERAPKKVEMSLSNSKQMHNSLHSEGFSSTYNTENKENTRDFFSASPVMTLDTKKLVLKPMVTSTETVDEPEFGARNHDRPEHDPVSFSASTLINSHSRYDPLGIQLEEPITEDHGNDFQIKSLDPSRFPLLSVSASMNYNPNQNHPTEQGGIITADGAYQDIQHFPDLLHPPNHLDGVHESTLRSAEEGHFHENNLPPPPPPEFIGSGKHPFPPVHESPSTSRFPMLDYGKHSSEFPPFRRIPLPLPFYTESNPYLRVAPSTDPNNRIVVTSNGYPHVLATSSHHPPLLQDHLPPPPPPPPQVRHNFPQPPHGPVPGHSHHVPSAVHPRHHQHQGLPFGSPPPPALFEPMVPFDIGSGRKAPSSSLEFENGRLSPPPPGVDPEHPIVQHALRNPLSVLKDGFIDIPVGFGHAAESNKKYNLHYTVPKSSLIPLDKRLVYLSMIFSWMFWISAFYSYYRWHVKGNKAKPVVLNVPKNGESPQVTARSLDSQWNFTKVLEYIEIAQKTYEGFDWQDLNCQKRTLCELVQNKQAEPWGETGRKLADNYVTRVMDALNGLPIPRVIQSYLKEYKEAITQGKNSSKDCGQVYTGCKFSIKDVLNKSANKKKA